MRLTEVNAMIVTIAIVDPEMATLLVGVKASKFASVCSYLELAVEHVPFHIVQGCLFIERKLGKGDGIKG